MARLFVRHQVQDFGKWLETYKSVADFQKRSGVTGEEVYQAADDPNDVTVIHDFASADKAREFVGLDELKAAMQRSGVTGAPEIWITEKG